LLLALLVPLAPRVRRALLARLLMALLLMALLLMARLARLVLLVRLQLQHLFRGLMPN
jgi:hypothetical protein